MTRNQVRDTLQVSLTTLHEWALDRPAVLLPVKMNGRVRYHKTAVLAALKETRRFKTNKADGGRAV